MRQTGKPRLPQTNGNPAKSLHTLFKKDDLARLLLDVLYENRKLGRFQLHEFVLMPDHIHLILTPAPDKSLERALQYIKGG